jgi:hypothetical protein
MTLVFSICAKCCLKFLIDKERDIDLDKEQCPVQDLTEDVFFFKSTHTQDLSFIGSNVMLASTIEGSLLWHVDFQ